MAVLLDTNILLRLLQPQHPHAALAERAIEALRRRDPVVNITAQNLVEFWAVITRPIHENGLGFTTAQALSEIRAVEHFFALLPEVPLQKEWERLITAHNVSGKNVHDARLVAAMMVHGIDAILTFNVQDFARYPISVLDPRDVR